MTKEEFEDLCEGDLVEVIDHPRFNNSTLKKFIGGVYVISRMRSSVYDNTKKAVLCYPDTGIEIDAGWSYKALKFVGASFNTDMDVLFGGDNA